METVSIYYNWWSEFGGAPDPYNLPPKIRTSILAIMWGQSQKQQEENRKAKQQSNNV